jgi:hypothetical protein
MNVKHQFISLHSGSAAQVFQIAVQLSPARTIGTPALLPLGALEGETGDCLYGSHPL